MTIKILLFLALAAMFMPVTVQYACASFLLLWWLWCVLRRWRGRIGENSRTSVQLRLYFWPVVLGVSLHMLLTVVASVIAYLMSTQDQSAALAAKETYHLAAKQGVLGLVLVYATSEAYSRGFRMRQVLPAFATFIVIYSAYLFAQRYTGIDWVRGIHAVLPENRFAHGVYRLSGFMGHPLSLAYNLVLVSTLIVNLLLVYWHELKVKNALLVCLALVCVDLAISGSRWPLAVVVVCMGIWGVIFLRVRWVYLVGALAFLAVFLFVEGSFWGRLVEQFTGPLPLQERFPRLIFFQVHWQMFRDHMLAGGGFGGAEALRISYYNTLGFGGMMDKFPAHNIFLQTLADSGLIGLAGLTVWLAGCVRSLRVAGRHSKTGFAFWLVPVVVLTGLFQNNLRDTEFLYAFWLVLVLMICELAVARKYVPTSQRG